MHSPSQAEQATPLEQQGRRNCIWQADCDQRKDFSAVCNRNGLRRGLMRTETFCDLTEGFGSVHLSVFFEINAKKLN
jgi:hypothetical protein